MGPEVVFRRPSRGVSLLVSAALVLAWGVVRLVVFPDYVLPLTYVLPLLVCIWTRDTLALWGMAAAFVVLHTIEMFVVLPGGALPASAFRATYLTVLINIGVGTVVVRLVIALRNSLEAALAQARAAAEEIRAQAEELHAQSEELAQQNAELEQQAEELSEQTEELAQQNEELQAQGDEIQSLIDDLAGRERLLQGLLTAARVSASEGVALERICSAGIELFATAEAVVVYEVHDGRLAVKAAGGAAANVHWPATVQRERRFAALVVDENRTAALNDAALRPDLEILQVPGLAPFRAVLAAPLQAEGASFGALAVYSREPREWTDDEFRLAEWLAGQCARILETLRLQNDLRRRAALIDLSPDAVFVRDLDGAITFWSAGARALYGYADAEVRGKRSHDLLQTRWAEPRERVYAALHQQGHWTGQLVHRAKDGRDVVVQSRWLARRSTDGTINEVLESNVDITDRERVEAALRVSEARLRRLAEAMPNLVWTATPDGGYDFLSPQWTEYTGMPTHEQLGDAWREQVHPADRDALAAAWSAAVQSGEPFDMEFRIRRYDGAYRWFKSRGVCQRDEQGAVAKWFGSNTDIEEHREAEELLRSADRRKSEFLATLSHELRNPLAAIRYALDVVGRAEHGDAQAVSVIDRQLSHLARLVDDLLDITRIGSNKFQLRKRRIDIVGVLEQGAEAASPQIQRGGHVCTVALPPAPIFVEADPDRLAQVVTNLLNNAARYTPAGGRITLAAGTTDGEVVISVADSGIGLREEDLGRVFDMFTQLAEPGQGGLGIGLALVKAVVELHGGRVEAQSAGEGRGSRFDVHLPIDPSASHALPVSGPAEAASSPAASRRVLVVDDNADAADMMKAMLEFHGHAVEVAYDGRSAVRALSTFTPEIALLDIGLPDMDGYELARVLRDDARTAGAYLVAVTGWGQEEDRARARERGFDAHLTKPADLAEITRLIGEAGGLPCDSEPGVERR